jgi:adenylate cyclase
MALEIERKFLMNEIGRKWVDAWMQKTPEYGKYKGSLLIDQGYLYVSDHTTTRVRYQAPMNMPDRIADGFVTKKTSVLGMKDVVDEEDIRIPPAAALILLDACQFRLSKHRVHIEYNQRLWEIDLFTDKGNDTLKLCELEFKSVEDRDSFTDLPPWVGEEVTSDHRYKNSYLVINPYNEW